MDTPEEATEAAEAAEQTDAAGSQDPPPPTDPAEAAAAEEAAIQAEIVAAARGKAPPPADGEGETGEEEGETETSQEGSEEDSTEAAEAAAPEGGEEAAEAEEGEQPSEGEAAGAQDDIWANASDEQRAAFEKLTKKAAAAEQGKRSAEGRESGLKRRLDALMSGDGGQEPDEKPETRQQPSEDEQKQAREALSAELKQFADDYPEIAKPLGKALAHLEGNITRLESEIGKRDDIIQRLEGGLQQIGSERHQANLADQEQIVYEAHPDYDEIAGSAEFVAWMEQQSPAMQAIIAPNVDDIVNGDDVAFVVERYKTAQGIVNDGGTDGASTAGQQNGSGERKPAADLVRTIQKRSAAAPRSSPGAVARETPRQETEEEVRREILNAERKKRTAAEARA